MTRHSVIPDSAIATIWRRCNEQAVRPKLRDKLRVDFTIHGTKVTLLQHDRVGLDISPELREILNPDAEWEGMKIAQLRYLPSEDFWQLYWSDRNERWHPDEFMSAGDLDTLLSLVEADKYGVYWG